MTAPAELQKNDKNPFTKLLKLEKRIFKLLTSHALGRINFLYLGENTWICQPWKLL